MLIVFGGLSGTGKTTLARELARALAATYLRIDTIEQSLRNVKQFQGEMDGSGYEIAYAIAESNLRLGQTVIADSVNPIALTRNAWRGVAEAAKAELLEIEVVCSDIAEHRRRIETRIVDVPGLTPPTWQEVVSRDYERWDRAHLVVDTARQTPEETLKMLFAEIKR